MASRKEIREYWLSKKAAAKLLNVQPRTVQRWAENGLFEVAYTDDDQIVVRLDNFKKPSR
jgi:predicted site-specific integrase-resolvase